MSVEVTENKDWFSNKWITFKLFDDILIFVDKETQLGKEVIFLNEVRIDCLALTLLDEENKKYFKEILDKVLEYNKEQQGADFYDPSGFEVYYKKILELKEMINEYI